MDLSLKLILEKLILGISLAAPIGPVSIEMIKRGLRHGFLAAFSVRLGGAMGNTLCLVATYYGLSHILANEMLLNAMALLGSALLIYMGVKTILKGVGDLNLDAPVNLNNGLLWGLYLAIANPVALVFWPSLFAASIDPAAGVSVTGLVLNMLIIVGVLIWGFGLSTVLSIGHQRLNKHIIVFVSRLSGVTMMYFGIAYIYEVITRIL